MELKIIIEINDGRESLVADKKLTPLKFVVVVGKKNPA